MWCVADLDEAHIANMEDVLATYERACDPSQPVACLDEKAVTLHADVRPGSPAKPGREARRAQQHHQFFLCRGLGLTHNDRRGAYLQNAPKHFRAGMFYRLAQFFTRSKT